MRQITRHSVTLFLSVSILTIALFSSLPGSATATPYTYTFTGDSFTSVYNSRFTSSTYNQDRITATFSADFGSGAFSLLSFKGVGGGLDQTTLFVNGVAQVTHTPYALSVSITGPDAYTVAPGVQDYYSINISGTNGRIDSASLVLAAVSPSLWLPSDYGQDVNGSYAIIRFQSPYTSYYPDTYVYNADSWAGVPDRPSLVPEPSTWCLVAFGLVCLAAFSMGSRTKPLPR